MTTALDASTHAKCSPHPTKLDRLMCERRCTQTRLAARLGISQGHVSRMCSGERPIAPSHVPEIADELGAHEEDILEDSARQVRVGVA